VADHLDVMPVGADDERGIVTRVIMRPGSRRAVILPSGGERSAVELIDLIARVRQEGEVKRQRLTVGLPEPERSLSPLPQADRVGQL
jgi:hypothetical protein